MINKKTYIVIKDIEGLTVGDEIVQIIDIYFSMDKCIGFGKKDVENDKEHFKLKEESKTYTEDDMRKCFEESRKMKKCENAMCRMYADFNEYLNNITS